MAWIRRMSTIFYVLEKVNLRSLAHSIGDCSLPIDQHLKRSLLVSWWKWLFWGGTSLIYNETFSESWPYVILIIFVQEVTVCPKSLRCYWSLSVSVVCESITLLSHGDFFLYNAPSGINFIEVSQAQSRNVFFRLLTLLCDVKCLIGKAKETSIMNHKPQPEDNLKK